MVMGEWLAIAEWQKCIEMARPGVIFELRNREGNSLFSPCTAFLPAAPFDWKSPAIEFRAVPEPAPQHSSPMPPPSKG
jgi:hypothetical protein